MKAVKRGDAVILLIEHTWENVPLKAHQGTVESVPLLLLGDATPCASLCRPGGVWSKGRCLP